MGELANGRMGSPVDIPLEHLLARWAAMELDHLFTQPERWVRVLAWATLAGVEFGLIGPFGSYASHLITRTAYWTALFWTGSLLVWPSLVFALMLGSRRGFPPLVSIGALVLLACIPLAVLGAIETHLYWPLRAASITALEWYGFTVVVALPATAALMWLELGRTSFFRSILAGHWGDFDLPERTAATPSSPSTLPDHILDNAICLQMEDHHVRVHMQARSYLYYAVMRDLVEAMDGRRGLTVHRSWWVARDAVRHWQQDGRSVSLILTNGLRVPVARNRVATLRADGWFDTERT